MKLSPRIAIGLISLASALSLAAGPLPASAETYYCYCQGDGGLCSAGDTSVAGTIDITGEVNEGSANEAKLRDDCKAMCQANGKGSCGTSTTPPAKGDVKLAPTTPCPPGRTVCLTNPLGTANVPTLIGNILKAAIGIVGALALLIFVYGGFLWLTSAGEAGKVEKGKEAMKWAIIGLAVVFSSYALVSFVLSALTKV